MVIWVTGLSGSGKTTLCKAVYALLKPNLPNLVLLDGDQIRAAFVPALGYSVADRTVQFRRLQGLAKMLEEQGIVVLVAALYSSAELLAWNRTNFAVYREVYIEAPLTFLQQRDSKGMYAAAAAGQMQDVVGVDIPWQAPKQADLVIKAELLQSPQLLAERVIALEPSLHAAP